MAPPAASDDARQVQQSRNLREEKLKNRKVLKEFREHHDEVERDRTLLGDLRSDALGNHLARADENVKKAKTVNLALKDAEIMKDLTLAAKQQADQLQTGLKTYDVTSFCEKLAQLTQSSHVDCDDEYGGSQATGGDKDVMEIDLISLGKSISNRFKSVPSLHFMHGNSDIQPRIVKAKKAMPREKRQKVAEKPKEVTAADQVLSEPDRQIAEMKDLLEAKGPNGVVFWRFVVDPDSFTRSIENIFHSAFLVKDGFASLNLKDEPPMIAYKEPSAAGRGGVTDAKDQQRQFKENSQYILRFDFRLWRKVVEQYSIVKCMLPSKSAPKWDELAHLTDGGAYTGGTKNAAPKDSNDNDADDDNEDDDED
jgi:non-structural maintenance of chromosomes element 4